MRIIINADDFGTNEGINTAIIELIKQGRVSSTSIIANGDAVGDALEFACRHPQISHGAHLNISCGCPLSRPDAMPFLLNDDKTFSYHCARSSFRSSWLPAIYREWCLQIESILTGGVSISHLDSECHVHTNPMMFPLLRKLGKRYGVQCLRNTKNIFAANMSVETWRSVYKQLWSFAQKTLGGMEMTDGFTDLLAFRNATEVRLQRVKTVEIMVHPGVGEYANETRYLKSKDLLNLLSHNELITYHDL